MDPAPAYGGRTLHSLYRWSCFLVPHFPSHHLARYILTPLCPSWKGSSHGRWGLALVFFTAERTGLSTQLGLLKVVNKCIYLQSRNDCLSVSPYLCLQISFLGCFPPCKLSAMDKHYLQRNKRKLIMKKKKNLATALTAPGMKSSSP